jgi:hypothetical protein
MADNLAAYSRIAEDKEAEANFIELRLRAVKKLGQLMQEQRESVGLAKGGGDQSPGQGCAQGG